MANEQYAFLWKSAVPTRDQWQAEIEACGFDFQLCPDLKPFEVSGFLPCTLSGREAGFEIYYDGSRELLSEFSEIAQDRDFCISFRWGGSWDEGASAMIASYVLAKSFGAKVSYEGKQPLELKEFLSATMEMIEEASRNTPDITSPVLARFLADHIVPQFGENYERVGRLRLVRMRGPFIQSVSLSRTTGGAHFDAFPEFHMLGVDLAETEFSGMAGLYVGDPRNWSFTKPELTPEFVPCLIEKLEAASPMSFFDEMTDASIDRVIDWSISRTNAWHAYRLRAFISVLQGRPHARDDLRRALIHYRKRVLPNPPLDYDLARIQRYEELIGRLDLPNCIALCRADAEEHAKQWKLPPIEWPPDWPTDVAAPWPDLRRGVTERFAEWSSVTFYALINDIKWRFGF